MLEIIRHQAPSVWAVALALCTLCYTIAAVAQPAPSALMAATELRVGVERLAKLHYEHAAAGDPSRAQKHMAREKDRVLAALAVLRNDRALAATPRNRVASVEEGVRQFIDSLEGASQSDADQIYRDSEALASRISFVGVTVSSLYGGNEAQLVDLVTRAAATALRVGKINFATTSGLRGTAVSVDAAQALIEFSSALQSIGAHQLDARTRAELELAQQQWLLLRMGLNAQGSLRDATQARNLATTSDRIAEALLALARRSVKPAAP